MNKPTKDDIYAYALSKTLTNISSPATVGLYSSCSNRSKMILEQMEECMNHEASRIEQKYEEAPKPRSSSSFAGFLAVVGRLLFYRPVWTEENQQQRNIRFIHVHFSAWHFAGSDLLWAGIAVRLFQAMHLHFGKLQLVLYREAQYDEEDEVKKKIVEDGPNSWRSKKLCCCPLWFLFLCILVIPLIILTVVLVCGPPKPVVPPTQNMTTTSGHFSFVEGFLIASIGLPAVSALRFVFLVCKDLIFSQEFNLKRGMDNQQISGQLGFMNEVRREMYLLSRFMQFMELFERRKIRVVLQITNLDRCSPKKIIGVLEAINILLSDEDSPFISILAVNPHVLVEKVNFADGCYSREDRAYALLNRIVTLAFTVPPLSDDSKRNLFSKLINKSKISEKPMTGEIRRIKRLSSARVPLVEVSLHRSESNAEVTSELDRLEVEVESLIWSILKSNEEILHQYMFGDDMSMRRVINSIRVTIIIMKALKDDNSAPDHIAAWVVLANQWPCRLSWIIQCVKDAQQREEIDGEGVVGDYHLKTLWEVFSESKAELYEMSAQIEDLLEQDGDPELFEKFLTVDFQFTIGDLQASEMMPVNLDNSIRKKLAQIRGRSTLGDSAWMRSLNPLPRSTIINMKTEDICKELEKMNYPCKYINIVKSNDLNGLALVFGDTQDLKALFNMNLGEWATFKLHFLSSPSYLQQQYRNTPPSPPHLKNQLSTILIHAPHRSSSNLSLENMLKSAR